MEKVTYMKQIKVVKDLMELPNAFTGAVCINQIILYYHMGFRHNEKAPAVEFHNGHTEYYLKGFRRDKAGKIIK